MIANRMKPVLLAGMMLAAAFPSLSHAGDGRDHGRRHALSAPVGAFAYNGDPAAFISRSGIFSGTFDVVRTASRSIYILRNYQGAPLISPVTPMTGSGSVSPSVKIIDVAGETRQDAFAPIDACAYEAGVCIIRGGN
ncbi:hypothetical protein ACFFP0_03130 [Rhizobium puerariae]|uniref:Uncharacterized protein n=1 Tax=Rhizobium puerariae TaxID=1585791 RepID=A0ABV6AB15_9HYPH